MGHFFWDTLYKFYPLVLISFNVVIIGVDKGVIIKLNGKIADEGNIVAGEHGMGT